MNKHFVLPLALSILFYTVFFHVRTLQAELRSNLNLPNIPTVNLWGIPDLSFNADQLRWLSYLILGGIILGYVWAIRLVHRKRDNGEDVRSLGQYRQWVILPYGVLGLMTLVLYPHVTSPIDTADYAMYVRVQMVHGSNPYSVPGIDFTAIDPMARYMEAKQRPSVYGPVWQYISLVPGLIGNGQIVPSILAFKFLFFASGLVCLWLIWVFHSHPSMADHQQALIAGVSVAWNPLLHLISHGEGHNDIVMAVFMAGIFVTLVRDQPLRAFGVWALSVLVKFISVAIGLPLLVYVYFANSSHRVISKFVVISAGLGLSVSVALIAFMPFGVGAVVNTISGRYGGLVEARGDSKISLAVGLVTQVLRFIGIDATGMNLATWVGLALPLAWLIFTLVRSRTVRDLPALIRVSVESFLFYLTFVAIPVYAQYAIPLVILLGFLCNSRWHYWAVILTCLALAWDSVFLVNPSRSYLTAEIYLHQISHMVVLGIILVNWSVGGAAWWRKRAHCQSE